MVDSLLRVAQQQVAEPDDAHELSVVGNHGEDATDVAPAWRSPDFVMEEIVVTAEAPSSYYMEEIVVVAEVPSSYYMEEIVVTARLEDLPARLAMRTRFIRNMRNVLHF